MTQLRLFFHRHPLGWRMTLALSSLMLSLLIFLAAQDWPSLTPSGALRRLARECASSAGRVVATGQASSRFFTTYQGPGARARWALAYDGTRYQIGLLERCVSDFLWRPSSSQRTYYPGPALPFQVVDLTPQEPLQCALVYSFLSHPVSNSAQNTVLSPVGVTQVERFCLIFSQDDLSRIEVWQTAPGQPGVPPDWTAPMAGPILVEQLLDGVWTLSYTEPEEDPPRLRLTGYDTTGAQVCEAFPAPW